MYLPKGSWIDLEREARLDGGWIVKEKRIDEIPLFLRENRGLFGWPRRPCTSPTKTSGKSPS